MWFKLFLYFLVELLLASGIFCILWYFTKKLDERDIQKTLEQLKNAVQKNG